MSKPARPLHTLTKIAFACCSALLLFVAWIQAPALAQEARLVDGSLVSDLVPSPVEYSAVLPPGYDQLSDLPLVLNLHGGGGSREVLKRQVPMFEELFTSGEMRPMVVVMASVTARGFYMDFKDGSEKWESFLLGPFLDHVRERFKVSSEASHTFLTGISMGGMGSSRMAFKYPERFGAVAIMEPGIEPILEFSEMRPKHRFWRSDELLEKAYGSPVDPGYWAANNPATLVRDNADAIRASGIAIFLEAGDEDLFWLYEGTEFLHQMLWDQKIRHEYRLYLGADHVGESLGWRTREAFRFLSRQLDPPKADPRVEAARKRIDRLKSRLSEADHYGVDADKVKSPPR